jgi:hypothetical protein
LVREKSSGKKQRNNQYLVSPRKLRENGMEVKECFQRKCVNQNKVYCLFIIRNNKIKYSILLCSKILDFSGGLAFSISSCGSPFVIFLIYDLAVDAKFDEQLHERETSSGSVGSAFSTIILCVFFYYITRLYYISRHAF